jgi:hypothetical protein
MAKAATQSFDLSDYDYDLSSPAMPSDRAARNHVIEKGSSLLLDLVNLKMQTFQKTIMVEDS